jgi:hypothetical protein
MCESKKDQDALVFIKSVSQCVHDCRNLKVEFKSETCASLIKLLATTRDAKAVLEQLKTSKDFLTTYDHEGNSLTHYLIAFGVAEVILNHWVQQNVDHNMPNKFGIYPWHFLLCLARNDSWKDIIRTVYIRSRNVKTPLWLGNLEKDVSLNQYHLAVLFGNKIVMSFIEQRNEDTFYISGDLNIIQLATSVGQTDGCLNKKTRSL